MVQLRLVRENLKRLPLVKLKSYHRSKQEAEEFAQDLRLQGARGVVVGKKEKTGYPVCSTLLDELGFGNFSNLNFRGQ